MLELAVLGFLAEYPMHGYELRKRLTEMLGTFRAFSCGSIYPTLRKLQQNGYIVEDPSAHTSTAAPASSRRGKRVYCLTAKGAHELDTLLSTPTNSSFADDGFGVHLAFFSRTPADARVRVIEGRRRVLEERREGQRDAVSLAEPGRERYTRQLHLVGLENSERELRWLNELLVSENALLQGSTSLDQGTAGNNTDGTETSHSALDQNEGERNNG